MNVKWHEQHVMPRRASLEQRMEWHREHQAQCACRPIPPKLLEQMKQASPSAAEPSAAESRFSNIVLAFADEPAVTYGGKGFGSRALKLGGQMFALLSSKGEFVVRLSRERAEELVAGGRGQYFDPGHGRLMKEWLVAPGSGKRWLELAREAHTIAQGRRSRAPATARRPRAPARVSAAAPARSTEKKARKRPASR